MDYLKDPAAIYAKSFATIQSEVDFSAIPADVAPMVERMIHACGMVDLVNDVAFAEDVMASAASALLSGAPIITDCDMVKAGIIETFLPAENDVVCTLYDQTVPIRARQEKTTRSAAQVSLWHDRLAGSVIVIGNAPTALFALLETLDKGAPKPAAIIASPVGFVGAEEAKAELAANPRGVPFMTVTGRRGGSAIASAAFNAVAKICHERIAA